MGQWFDRTRAVKCSLDDDCYRQLNTCLEVFSRRRLIDDDPLPSPQHRQNNSTSPLLLPLPVI